MKKEAEIFLNYNYAQKFQKKFYFIFLNYASVQMWEHVIKGEAMWGDVFSRTTVDGHVDVHIMSRYLHFFNVSVYMKWPTLTLAVWHNVLSRSAVTLTSACVWNRRMCSFKLALNMKKLTVTAAKIRNSFVVTQGTQKYKRSITKIRINVRYSIHYFW